MKSPWLRLLFVLLGVIALNVLAGFVPFRLDLTEDRRYSLSKATENLLGNLEEELFVDVYLDGELPAGFQRLQNSIRETLDEFKVHAGNRLTYRFIDPSEISDPKERAALYDSLAAKGIVPTNVIEGGTDDRRERLIFPGAVLRYGARESAVLLLRGNVARSAQENLNLSAENVEFNLATALRELTRTEKKKIGLLSSYSPNVPGVRLSDLIVSLQKNYELFQVNLPASPNLDGLDAVLVVKPEVPFAEADQFKLDQFIVKGGRALFFVDAAKTDSVGREGVYAFPNPLNLDDLLFRYGVRLNPNLVRDVLSARIPLNVGTLGDKPNIQLVPWRLYPLINSFGASPIVRNLDAVYVRGTGTLDTVRASGIAKIPLLLTSPNTQVLQLPAIIPYNEARQPPSPEQYQAGVQLISCLLEGTFRSAFENRILPGDPRAQSFVATGQPSKILVCADGDLPLNDFDARRQVPLPLGFDRFSSDRHVFANKEFILNAVDYLLDENGVITARNKEVRLRPLDTLRLRDERLTWQVLNLAGPLVLVGLLGGVWYLWRRRRFAG
jgi:gliding-associated putative ABC transporter substrate-binding component GldG